MPFFLSTYQNVNYSTIPTDVYVCSAYHTWIYN